MGAGRKKKVATTTTVNFAISMKYCVLVRYFFFFLLIEAKVDFFMAKEDEEFCFSDGMLRCESQVVQLNDSIRHQFAGCLTCINQRSLLFSVVKNTIKLLLNE